MILPTKPLMVLLLSLLSAHLTTPAAAKPLLIRTNVYRNSSSGETYVRGPVIERNFPDPSIIYWNGTWWAFATENESVHIQVASSPDFVDWTYMEGQDALPDPPAWVNASAPNTWAPDVNLMEDGTFVMYFSATTVYNSSLHCIGAATATNPQGPYAAEPTTQACPLDEGGAIDSSGFKDWQVKGSGWGPGNWNSSGVRVTSGNGTNDCWSNQTWWGGGRGGQRYIVYKVDGNALGNGNAPNTGTCGNTIPPLSPTPIMLQAVDSSGLQPIGTPTVLLQHAGLADDGLIEAPSLFKTARGTYILFFSSGCFNSDNYTVSYATADAVTGPYTRAAAPLLATGSVGQGVGFEEGSGGVLRSPGGMDVYWDGRHMVLHADYPDVDTRALWIAEIDVTDGVVSV
ncbi:glycosyl hydrolase [Phyllosticta capitalensis]|uniref:Glycosyl hydrolase n=1 Tax=Phyllosticta capitalensis TaxID=121624 RepID=A0ABR1YKD8_9PEZI